MYGIADIRLQGSGNSGATNVARTLGRHFFLPVFTLDVFKAYATLCAAAFFALSPVSLAFCAAALIVGNSYSVFLDFHGGKAVATSVGIVSFFCPQFFFILIPVFIGTFFCTKTVGIASVASLSLLPFLGMYYQLVVPIKMLLLFVSFLGVIRHKDNLKMYFKKECYDGI